MHVLVTGAGGYLGSILCEHLLNAGYRVTALDNLMYGQHSLFHFCANPRFEFVRGDVRDEALMRRLLKTPQVIIPMAAIVGTVACDKDPWTARSVNVEAVQMLNSLRNPNQLIIYPNTNSGYGIASKDLVCTEETPFHPISLYGRTKTQAEALLLKTPNVVSLRLATVFGMSPRLRLDLLVNHFVHVAVTDRYIVIFEKDFKRNYVHIRDVADCFIHCIEHFQPMSGGAFNLGLDNANFSKAELAFKIKEHIPHFYIHFSEIGNDPDKRDYTVSSERLRKAGFEAKRSLDDGIAELLKGYGILGRAPFGNA